MASLNKVFLMGNLTRDPELRYTPNGMAVSDLPIAVNNTWTSKDGEKREEVLFIDVTVWSRQAETCCQYLKKGRPIHVEGSLKMDSWDDKTTGEKRKKITVVADRVQFLDRREDGPGGGGGGQGDRDVDFAPPSRGGSDRRPAPAMGGPSNGPSRPTSAPAPRRPTPPPPVDSDEEEDIPF